jgi:hypothetical protein
LRRCANFAIIAVKVGMSTAANPEEKLYNIGSTYLVP